MTNQDHTIMTIIDRKSHAGRRFTKWQLEAFRKLAEENLKRGRPEIGDYIRSTITGRLFRLAIETPRGFQFSDDGSYYVSATGFTDFSGSLYPSIERFSIEGPADHKLAPFWTFAEGRAEAHNAVRFEMIVPVWEASIPEDPWRNLP